MIVPQALGGPGLPLSDGVISLRLPVAADQAQVAGYAALPGGLDGGWLPLLPPLAPGRAGWLVEDWLAGWAGQPSHNGPALVISPIGSLELVGMVGFGSRDLGVVEMVYGVAPGWRGQGVARRAARRAARLAADWLTRLPGVEQVELRIGSAHLESQRAEVAAGFVRAGTVRDVVQQTGERYEDLRFTYVPLV